MEINIAICDDDKNYINEIIQYLNNCSWKRNNSFVYHTFYCGEALLESKQYFDFIILDIEMDKVSGIEVKEIFYNRNNQSRIIFLTNYVQANNLQICLNYIFHERKFCKLVSCFKIFHQLL